MSDELDTRLTSVGRLHWQMRSFPAASLAEAVGRSPILVLAPHPDDETLGCGGLIATACEAGIPVHVLVLTDGAGSHPKSVAYPPPRLRCLREEESRAAGRALGLSDDHIAFLGLPDTAAPHSGEAAERAACAIAEHARVCGARTLFTSWRHDPHCDHQAASILAERAASLAGAALYEYPVWGWTLPSRRVLQSAAVTGFRLDVSSHLAAKRRAIACHRSQLGEVVTDDPDGFALQAEFLDLFTGPWETFIRVHA